MSNRSVIKDYGYVWVTLILFVISLIGHWVAAWFAYVDQQQTHQQSIAISQYFIEVIRDTLENWQSEFLQLIWQVAGLAFLWYLGSPQSKEGDERKEEKLDAILKLLDKKNGAKTVMSLDKKYPRQ